MKYYGLILAAGLSSRMGNFKPLMNCGETTIIKYGVRKMIEACGDSQNVFVVVGNRGEDIKYELKDEYVNILKNNRYKESDMFASILIGIREILTRENDDDYAVFILPGDMPAVSIDTLNILKNTMEKDEPDIVFPTYNGRKKHPPLIKAEALQQIINYSGCDGLRGAIKELKGVLAYIDVKDFGCTIDTDTPEDYNRLIKYLAKK